MSKHLCISIRHACSSAHVGAVQTNANLLLLVCRHYCWHIKAIIKTQINSTNLNGILKEISSILDERRFLECYGLLWTTTIFYLVGMSQWWIVGLMLWNWFGAVGKSTMLTEGFWTRLSRLGKIQRSLACSSEDGPFSVMVMHQRSERIDFMDDGCKLLLDRMDRMFPNLDVSKCLMSLVWPSTPRVNPEGPTCLGFGCRWGRRKRKSFSWGSGNLP